MHPASIENLPPVEIGDEVPEAKVHLDPILVTGPVYDEELEGFAIGTPGRKGVHERLAGFGLEQARTGVGGKTLHDLV